MGKFLHQQHGRRAKSAQEKTNPSKMAGCSLQSIELFAGCGGLALGVSEAGFRHALVVEYDLNATATLQRNKDRAVRHFSDWKIASADVRSIQFSKFKNRIDLVTGGPPCQPFSIGGKHKGPTDSRNMWPEAIRAVKEAWPKAFIFENVRGLLRPMFRNYLRFLELQLSWPELYEEEMGWEQQYKKLQKHEKKGMVASYRVLVQGINAADYGAPQKRHRAIVMGIRSDIVSTIRPLQPTHSHEALVWSQRVTGDYWQRHKIAKSARPSITAADQRILERLRANNVAPVELPWVTVRDAIGDLPRPSDKQETFSNHRLHPGARIYTGHTGSALDEPAKALKAGNHGVPGGENILVTSKGSVRYFTVREMSRLQGLPDDFTIDESTWSGPIKQLGNAVPVQVGRAFGRSIKNILQ